MPSFFTTRWLRAAGAAALLLSFSLAPSHSALAATVLGLDFGSGSTQSGFSGFALTTDGPGPVSRTFSVSDSISSPSLSITATVAAGSDATNMANNTGSLNQRTRGNAPANSGAFTQNALLQDRIVSTTGAGLFLELTGLAPNTTFSIQVWGYDTQTTGTMIGSKSGTFTLLDRTNGANTTLGSITNTLGQLPTDNNTFSITANVTSDANGKIVVQSVSNIDGTGILTGAAISTSTVPEPGRGMMGLMGLGLLLWRRRRK